MMNKEDLTKILEKHLKWINNEEDGTGADLIGADLIGADLTGADLFGADLFGANLTRADLTRANLFGANLTRADLFGANLTGADLTRADLTRADLTGTNLTGANLTGADLTGADLTRANLTGADLTGADLTGANLTGAEIDKKLINKFFPLCCPETGSFVGWKKCCEEKIVKLEILEDAKRSSAFGRKCRCSKAKVIDIESFDGNNHFREAHSSFDTEFVYKIGEIVEVADFDEDRTNECAAGIHFFITRQEAVDY